MRLSRFVGVGSVSAVVTRIMWLMECVRRPDPLTLLPYSDATGVGSMVAAWRSRFGVSICAFAPFERFPVSISCALNLRPPFGFTGVGIIPAWRLAWPCNWLNTSPRPPRSASDFLGVARIMRSGYVDPAPPPAPSFIPSEAIGVGNG